MSDNDPSSDPSHDPTSVPGDDELDEALAPVEEPSPGFDPFAGLYTEDGRLDPDVLGRRLPHLNELLRHEPTCFELRVDPMRLGKALAGEAGAALSAAATAESFETALRIFSRDHLLDFLGAEELTAAREVFATLAADETRSRRKRSAAAAGVALGTALPDDRGAPGRALGDVILRISLEEMHAHEELRERAQDVEGGLTETQLAEFWKQYPALRHRIESDYRRDVAAAVDAVEAEQVPSAVSVDLALRGAQRLLSTVAQRRATGRDLEDEEVHSLLLESFEDDMLDGGRKLVLHRWLTAATRPKTGDAPTPERDWAEKLVRIAAPGGPGGEALYFQAYVRAVLGGSFHVQDSEEGDAARGVFRDDGLSAEGVLEYAEYLANRGDFDSVRRSLVAAVELWPNHAVVLARASQAAENELAAAAKERLGPRYDEADDAIDDDDDDDDE